MAQVTLSSRFLRFVLASGLAAFSVWHVCAATFTVTNTANSGAGSLSAAIASATASPGNTIVFSLPNPSTIAVTSTFTIGGSGATIDGGRYGAVIINGGGTLRPFIASAGTIVLRNLRIEAGLARGGNGGVPGGGGGLGAGGCLLVTGSANVTLDTVGFFGCTAQGGNGGAAGSTTAQGGGGGGSQGSAGSNGAGTSSGAGGSSSNGFGIGGHGGDGNNVFLGSGSSGSAGGIGGGGGAGGGATSGGSGNGGVGGFGGGGGGGGYGGLGNGSGGAAGTFAGFGGGGTTGTIGGGGGGGAALGPAVFVLSGTVAVIGSGHLNSSATGGLGGGGGAGNGTTSGTALHNQGGSATGTLASGLPVTATTGAASVLSATTATLNGIINAGQASTTVTFDIGTTPGYGTSIAATPSPVSGTSDTPVSAAAGGLACGTTYHFRLKGVSSVGTSNGADATFSTSPCTQTITFGAAPAVFTGKTATVIATASSGLAVTYSSTTPATCTVDSTTGIVSGISAGACTIAAAQAGNASYLPAQASQNLTVSDPARLLNISTRMQVLTGNDRMIAGFIIGGATPKKVVINVAGPSLVPYGIANALMNPKLTLVRSSDQSVIESNDDWPVRAFPADVAAIQASGFQPNNDAEPAIIATLAPGAYTAIVEGVGNTTGVGLVGIFEVDHPEVPLINISTRGQVLTANDVMIAGFIVAGTGSQTVVVNVAGPSLVPYGITNALMNPKLTVVRSSDQTVVATNDDWQTQGNPADVAAIQATGFQPNNTAEPAVLLTLPPGAYTVIVEGMGATTGVGLVGVFTTP
jgi:hypothetical protein